MKITAIVGALIIGSVVLLLLLGNDNLGIDVKSCCDPIRSSLNITNVGAAPIRIEDVSINERAECSKTGLVGAVGFPFDEISDDLLHKFWVSTGVAIWEAESTVEKTRALLSARQVRTLKVGDSISFRITCAGNIIRASVRTDKGASTYSFK